MTFDTRAAVVREAVSRLADDRLDPQDLLDEAAARIRRVVPYDLGGFMTLDPDTLLPTGNVRSGKSSALVDAFWRNELLTPDLHKFTELAGRRSPLATLNTVDESTTDVSPRRQFIHIPAGLGDEARIVFRANGAVWGAACLHREDSAGDFDAEERAFLAAIASDLGRGLQHALSRGAGPDASPATPGVVTLDHELRVSAATAEATQLIRLFPGDPTITIFGVAARVQDRQRAARARVRLTDGRWLLLHAAHLRRGGASPHDEVAVILDPAPRNDVTSLLLRLHGLSARERDVAELLLAGISTDELATRLHISRHTLRDHVKAIFTKFGASSRSELMARIAENAPETIAANN